MGLVAENKQILNLRKQLIRQARLPINFILLLGLNVDNPVINTNS